MMRNFKFHGIPVTAFLICLISNRASSAVVITASQIGSDVVLSASGSFNLLSFPPDEEGFTHPVGYANDYFSPGNATIALGGTDFITGEVWLPTGVSGPGSFGSGGLAHATSFIGDTVGLDFISVPGTPIVWLPTSYVTNSAISGTTTFENQTIATLGMTPGTYTWTWMEGAVSDSLTLEVVPEASTTLMWIFSLGFGLTIRRRASSPQPT